MVLVNIMLPVMLILYIVATIARLILTCSMDKEMRNLEDEVDALKQELVDFKKETGL